ncbi:tetratricopeptide repeat protein [Flagellimonas sp. S174]|uniref:type IX secretion system periplasmic lipoprotein PorW/SprE n=1 Tax=Flagellimonas sp. S174 TaxID=3410790 RepID=UPI003BF57B7F
MNHFQKIFGALVLVGALLNSCSVKKDKFINRNWHALNTKYNTLYNGNLAFEVGREELNANYRDDFWEILPVERLEVTDEVKLDSENNNPNFEVAEEKATKAIQKHSMNIKDQERNPQIDEAFLLLGKARYFDQRYIPALESFNYILRKYAASDKLNEARIWREKTHMRLDNPELAVKNLKRMFKYEDLRNQEHADASAVLAQCYINLKAPDTAIQRLKIAQAYTRKNAERGRYLFIIGQLYNQLNHKDSANYAFNKVIDLNRKSPRVYMINAHLKKIQNIEITNENQEEVLEYLTDLEENRENRPFLDKIYREVAQFHLGTQSDSLALVYYNKSLKANQGDKKLSSLNYQSLADYHFDENNYRTSGAYYDSTLTNLKENTRKFRRIKKKLDNLEDVIKYEDIAQYADSVITIYDMPEAERKAYFEDYIAELKRKDEAEAAKELKRTTAGFAAFGESRGGKENKGKFYFYNITSLGYGKNDFKTRWGNRALEDDWRWSNKSRTLPSEATGEDVLASGESPEDLPPDQKYDLDFYLSRVPTEISVIDSLQKEENFANYQLGLIYKEKFKENLLAAGKLEDVLKSDPEERLILPSKYNLYKIYEESGSPLAESMKQNIITNHSDTRYAEILLNPQAVLEGDTDSPDARYSQLFKSYQKQEFLRVITQSQEYVDRFTGDPIVPKFEMLKANAIGRLQGFEPFKEALNYVALTYPNNVEGKRAELMVKEQLPKMASKEFSKELGSTGTGNWKVVFPYKIKDNEKALALKKRLEEVVNDLKYKNVISKDIYNLEDQFVVVHGFKSQEFALGFVELIKKNRDYRIKEENFVVLSENYKVIQIHKNLESYKEQMLTP